MGDCLLVRYCEADQEPGVAEQNRENERRRQKREEYAAAFKAANPDKQFRMNKEQSAECKWSPEGLRLKLRMETAGVDCDLHEALLMSNLRDGDRLVLFPRWTVDERLPVAERKEFTPTPKQMLYGQRAELIGVVATEKDASGRVTAAFAEVELKESRGSDATKPFVFPAFNRTLEDGKLYTLDPCPNDWYGYWLRPGRQRPVRRPAERPVRPARDAAASWRRGRLAGSEGVPGRTRRLPPGRAAARVRGRQAGVHRRSWPDAGAAGPGSARNRQEL